MAKSTFAGPLKVGPTKGGSTANLGTTELVQQVAFVPAASITAVTTDGVTRNEYNGLPAVAWSTTTAALASTYSMYVPPLASITEIMFDTSATTGGTAINATIGATAGGAEYSPLADIKAGGRIYPTMTTVQVPNLSSVAVPPLVVQVAPTVSVVTAGTVIATVKYVQK